MTIDVKESLAQKIVDFLKQFEDVRIVKQENYYIDELGDLIEVRDGKEYVVPTKEDIEAVQKSEDEFVSLDELKKELNV